MEIGFKNNGYEYYSLSWQNYRFNNGIEGLRKEILRLHNQIKPDIVFIQVQLPEIIDVFTAIKLSISSFVINYTEDVRKDTTWLEEIGFYIGLTIFTNREDVDKFKQLGLSAVYLQTSFNDLWYKPQPKTSTDYGEIIFIGNNYIGTSLDFDRSQFRAEMVRFLKDTYGDRFKVYGMGWGTDSKLLNPQQCIEAYNNCKISISQSNFNRNGYSSDRLYNSMACGAFTLPEYFKGIEDLFIDGKHIESWASLDGLKDNINHYLQYPKDREAIAKMGCQLVRENYNWTQRIKELKLMLP
jgi:spore maturation protein CgeB